MKRLFDLCLGIPAAVVSAPLVALACFKVWREDGHSPLYLPRRIGRDGEPFVLYKIRSMVVGADRSKVDTTVDGDPRLLRCGAALRRFKLDELPQFWNVVAGTMSLVGPRPNVAREVELYTAEERRILTVKPGITDFASIVFSDLSERLKDVEDANIAYNQLVRPYKGRLALYYVENHNLMMDLCILWFTAVAIVDRRRALTALMRYLRSHGAPIEIVDLCNPDGELAGAPPVGATEIVRQRKAAP